MWTRYKSDYTTTENIDESGEIEVVLLISQ